MNFLIIINVRKYSYMINSSLAIAIILIASPSGKDSGLIFMKDESNSLSLSYFVKSKS